MTSIRLKYAAWITAAVLIGTFGLTSGLYAKEKTSVAVFDFEIGTSKSIEIKTSRGGSTRTERVKASSQTNLLTNKLITQLVNTGEITVVERKKLNRIMEEVKLSQQELTDPNNSVEVGKLLGADYMVFGSITMFDPSVSVEELAYGAGTQKTTRMTVGATMRLINVETGEVAAAADTKATNSSKTLNSDSAGQSISQSFVDSTLTDLTKKLANNIVNTVNPIKVAKQDGNVLYLARAGLTEGDQYKVVKLGSPIRDPDTDEVLGRTTKKVAVIKITGKMQNLSKAKVVEWSENTNKEIPPGSVVKPQ